MNQSVNLTMSILNEKRQGSSVRNKQETIDAAGQTALLTFSVSPMCQRRNRVYVTVVTHTLNPEPVADEWISDFIADF